ncbi:MAG TPA: hypothetical protein VGC91_17890 [Pyrinomonadaceae bacterium]|jgi:hypothetical protein
MNTISEQEFKKLCDDIFRDRREIYAFNPNMSRREALLWMLAGCLINLLSVSASEEPRAFGADASDTYANAVVELLEKRAAPLFDPKIYLAELIEKLDAEI